MDSSGSSGDPGRSEERTLVPDKPPQRRDSDGDAEDRARDILESITDAFFAIGRSWRFTYVNRQAERLLGRAPGDLLGKVIWDEYPGLRGSEFEHAYRRAAEAQALSTVTAFYPDHNRWYEAHVYPSRRGIAIYFRDVTEAKRAEQELRASEERYRHAADAARSAAEANAKFRVFFEQGTQFAGVLTLEGTVVEANRLCLEFCGFERHEVLGRPFWDCGWWNRSPVLVDTIRAAFARAARGELFRTETPYFIADGSERIVDLVLAPVTDDAGRMLFVAATGTDITNRKLAEAAAREGEARFRTMADSAPVLLWQADDTGVVFMNRHYLAFFGRAAAALTGMGWAEYLHPDDAGAYLETYHQSFAAREAYERHARFRRDDGEYRWLQNVALPHHDADGNFLGLMGCSVDVSNLRNLEDVVRNAERRAADTSAELDRILASVGEGFVALDRQFRYVYVNPAAEQLVGLRKEDVLGRTPWEVFSPEVVAESRQHLEEAAATSQMVQYELYLPSIDRWYENRVYPARDSLSLFFSDVTQRKRAEQALLRSEESQRLLVAINDATRHLKDPQAVMAQIVALVGRHFGVGRCTYGEVDHTQQYVLVDRDYTDGVGSIAGRHRLDDFGPEVIRELKTGRTIAIPDLAADPRSSGAVATATFSATETRALLCVPLLKEGRFVALFVLHHPAPRAWTAGDVALLEQVAERTWFAVEHARAEAAARETGDVLSLAMRGGRMGYWSRNMLTDEVWWSRELEELFGLEPGGFAGTEDGFFTSVHEDDRPVVTQSVAAAVASARDYTVEFRFRTNHGEWRWMEGRGRAVYADDGRPTTLYGLGIDITERKHAEEALARARDAAESANRLKDQFLATLSHELRTPLNAILGYARMLRRDTIPAEKRQHAFEVMERNAVAQAQLVEDLLDISRITTGKVRIHPEPMPAAAALREALESVKLATEAKQIQLEVDIDAGAGTVNADATRLQQVFWNLLSNAVKFTGTGGRIRVTLERRLDSVVASVSDSGTGIAPEFLPYVFEAFHQADGRFSREYGGLGLGLAICKQLIELHGGTIRAASSGRGRGATFTVELPRRVTDTEETVHPTRISHLEAETVEPVSARARPLPDAPQLTGVDVLVVDNDPDALDMLRHLLEHAGATVRTVDGGRAALAEFGQRVPHLLITDLGLPEMDGFELLRHVRGRRPAEGGRVVAVAVTAYARQADRSRALLAGFRAHVAKPVDPETFIAAVIDASQS